MSENDGKKVIVIGGGDVRGCHGGRAGERGDPL